jgi:hypothetical protein
MAKQLPPSLGEGRGGVDLKFPLRRRNIMSEIKYGIIKKIGALFRLEEWIN